MAVVAPPRSQLTDLFVILVVLIARGTGVSVAVTSWFRSQAENARVGGSPTSLHLAGLALDLVGTPQALQTVASVWRAIGFQAIFESDHLHIELDRA